MDNDTFLANFPFPFLPNQHHQFGVSDMNYPTSGTKLCFNFPITVYQSALGQCSLKSDLLLITTLCVPKRFPDSNWGHGKPDQGQNALITQWLFVLISNFV